MLNEMYKLCKFNAILCFTRKFDVEKLFKNLDYLMNIVDYIYEFRILGGAFYTKKIRK